VSRKSIVPVGEKGGLFTLVTVPVNPYANERGYEKYEIAVLVLKGPAVTVSDCASEVLAAFEVVP
jgi:uncharacterized OB-fold protein